jgi:hypothetical protein
MTLRIVDIGSQKSSNTIPLPLDRDSSLFQTIESLGIGASAGAGRGGRCLEIFGQGLVAHLDKDLAIACGTRLVAPTICPATPLMRGN